MDTAAVRTYMDAVCCATRDQLVPRTPHGGDKHTAPAPLPALPIPNNINSVLAPRLQVLFSNLDYTNPSICTPTSTSTCLVC